MIVIDRVGVEWMVYVQITADPCSTVPIWKPSPASVWAREDVTALDIVLWCVGIVCFADPTIQHGWMSVIWVRVDGGAQVIEREMRGPVAWFNIWLVWAQSMQHPSWLRVWGNEETADVTST